ncbi:D-erythrulose reductase-like [Ruditapes philippinarum]|uniref:D-erythrulose reductase-like n=1 Tax=Ruditapes philippinarum TaxID=129788 RepID=UPI00295C15B5|nr:D-erythrulose reductase-like [Ruditapes philippinarum]
MAAQLNLFGKNILVTGAGRGIGRAISIALSKQGSNVYALSRTPSSLESLVKEHKSIVPIVGDVNDWEDTKRKIEDLNVMDGLVNNAGIINEYTGFQSLTKQQLGTYLETNLLGAINVTKVVAEKMIKEGKPGSIVNVSSMSSINPLYGGIMPYVISKAGLDAATRQFAYELGPHNIRVNSVNPSLVSGTDMTDGIVKSDPQLRDSTEYRTPMKRLVGIDDVSGAVVYLLSDLSLMVTATCHILDGGITNCIIV